jgi:uncharacterized protein YuzE
MVAVCRPFNGITINEEVEFLIDEDGKIIQFEDVKTAKKWLREHGITEEIMAFLMFVSVEDGDVWVSF